ncbi:MAG: phospho-sugar mutase [Tissierellia bacterium]|nr:phospho-sugar mutase [Tissierellia bacterium]
MFDYKEKYEEWLSSKYIDDKTKEELKKLDDEEEIKDRFYKNLEFGTAGLRGIVGAGTNRMNVYTVSMATQALAETIIEEGENAKVRGVAIARDVRNFSKEFTEIAAGVLAANGIKTYVFDDIRPTPMLSFAVRYLKTISGIVITASHNPQMYNGYKVYWEEGSQILEDTAKKILSYYDKLDMGDIKRMEFSEGLEKGIIEIIPKSVDDAYYEAVLGMAINDDIDKDIKIVFSPLNGTGNLPVRYVLDKRGFSNVNIVKEQEKPDPYFTTVGYPNPEDVKAFEYAKKLGKEIDADLLIATDPDCDRVAMMGKDGDDYYAFNGNQTGALLINYILNGLNDKNKLPENGAIVKSIVTGNMAVPVCEKLGVKMFETLTGFKNICALPNIWDKTKEYDFIFGYEESIGYTYGDHARDKDAVVSSMMIAEMAGYYKKQGLSLVDVLNEYYEKYGYFKEKLISLVYEGIEGQERIKRMMEAIRNEPLKEIEDMKLEKTIDFLYDDTGLPKSNVLKFILDDGSWYCVRPSGTEPKIKLYIYTYDKDEDKAIKKVKAIEEKVKGQMESIK